MVTKEKMHWSFIKFSMKEFLKEMYGDQFGEFVWGYFGGGGAWRVNLIWWQLNYELNPEAFEVCIPLSDYEQASVVQKLEGVIHRINHYPVDKY